MVLRLIRDLPGDEFLFVTVTARIDGFACPVGPPKPPRGLASATDARTTRLHRPQQRRSSRAPHVAHELLRPAIALAHTTSSRPPHPALHVRDDRDTPLVDEAGCRERYHVILKNRTIFLREDWIIQISLIRLANFRFWRAVFLVRHGHASAIGWGGSCLSGESGGPMDPSSLARDP